MSQYKQAVAVARKNTEVTAPENIAAAASTSMGIKLPPPPRMSKEEMLALVARRDAKEKVEGSTLARKVTSKAPVSVQAQETTTAPPTKSEPAKPRDSYSQAVAVARKNNDISAPESIAAAASTSMGIKLPKPPTQADLIEWSKQNRGESQQQKPKTIIEKKKKKHVANKVSESTAGIILPNAPVSKSNLKPATVKTKKSLPKISSRYGQTAKKSTSQPIQTSLASSSKADVQEVSPPQMSEVVLTVSETASAIVSAFAPGKVGVNIHINAPIEIHIHNGKRAKL